MPFTISLDKKEMTFKINNSLKILLSNNSRDFQIFDGLKNYVRDILCIWQMAIRTSQLVQSDTFRYDQFCFKPSSNILKYFTNYKFNSLDLKII